MKTPKGFALIVSIAAFSALSLLHLTRWYARSRGSKPLTVPQRLRPVLILFGDSLTQHSFNPQLDGWGAALQHEFAAKADVLNRGLSGYTTRWALHLAPEVRQTAGPTLRLVVVFFGANDHVLESSRPEYHVPLEEYSANLRKIILEFRQKRDCSGTVTLCNPPLVVVITPPPSSLPDRPTALSSQYARACKTVVETLYDDGVSVVDLNTAMLARRGTELTPQWHALLRDGLHFSAEGNRLVADMLLSHLRTWAPFIMPTSLPFHFPTHNAQSAAWRSGKGPLLVPE
eukprot:TRINITY_DN6393_c0_g1_i2.p1 TRINITY_DN6393_c0_g1~~TRINITY_DN6393_c0_g1_i2.p1  ORF type:complete len:287 (-),score=29.77 TRINITY_DN6393_c0_g1_i2:895-1755(-)